MSHISNQNVSVTKSASLYTIYISTQVSEKNKNSTLFFFCRKSKHFHPLKRLDNNNQSVKKEGRSANNKRYFLICRIKYCPLNLVAYSTCSMRLASGIYHSMANIKCIFLTQYCFFVLKMTYKLPHSVTVLCYYTIQIH